VRAKLKILLVQARARAAARHRPQAIDPFGHHDIGAGAVGCRQDRRQDPEQFVVPLPLPRGDCGVVVLQETPDLSQCHQVVDHVRSSFLMKIPEPLSNWRSVSTTVLAISRPGALQTGLPSTSNCRSETHAVPVPSSRAPKARRCPCSFSGSVTEYSAQPVVPCSERCAMLSNAIACWFPSSRSHSPANPFTSRVRSRPRNSTVLPAKSICTQAAKLENWDGLPGCRSIRTILAASPVPPGSTNSVSGGPPLQPPGNGPADGNANFSIFRRSSERVESQAGVACTALAQTSNVSARHARTTALAGAVVSRHRGRPAAKVCGPGMAFVHAAIDLSIQ